MERQPARSFEDLVVRRRRIASSSNVYKATEARYGLRLAEDLGDASRGGFEMTPPKQDGCSAPTHAPSCLLPPESCLPT
jgi:hypothetical protein